jgi:hypothetical protein
MALRPSPSLDPTRIEGTWSAGILWLVQFLDDNLGAAHWETRNVCLVTIVVLAIIRFACKDAYGVTWYQLIHAVVSAYLSFLAVWLNVFAAEPLTGTAEPLRSLLCQGPLTSLHRIVPAITMGYGFFDIIDGMSHGPDFVRYKPPVRRAFPEYHCFLISAIITTSHLDHSCSMVLERLL